MYFKWPIFNANDIDVKPGQRYSLDWKLPKLFANVNTSKLLNVSLLGYAVIENISIKGDHLEVIILITQHASPLIPIVVICTTLVAAMFFFTLGAPRISKVLSSSTILIISAVAGIMFLTGFGKRSIRA